MFFLYQMGSISEHKKRIKEHLDEINDALDYGLEKKPITIAFHSSACAIEFMEWYLHKKNLISSGKTIKHNWFERPKPEQKIIPLIERKLPVHFPKKEEIYELVYNIESLRDNLIYGKSTKEQVEFVLINFQKLKDLILNELKEEGDDLE